MSTDKQFVAYWRANLKLMIVLLITWFLVSFGAGIFFRDSLDQIQFFGYPLGLWFAQQGSIFTFVVLIFIYSWKMQQLDRRFGQGEE